VQFVEDLVTRAGGVLGHCVGLVKPVAGLVAPRHALHQALALPLRHLEAGSDKAPLQLNSSTKQDNKWG